MKPSLLNISLTKKVAKLEKTEDDLIGLLERARDVLREHGLFAPSKRTDATESLRKIINKRILIYNKKVARYNQILKYSGKLEEKRRYPIVD